MKKRLLLLLLFPLLAGCSATNPKSDSASSPKEEISFSTKESQPIENSMTTASGAVTESTVPTDNLPTEKKIISMTASKETTTPTIRTSITTEAATTVSFESADCSEVSMELPDHPFISPRREIDREFPLNLAGIGVLNYYFPFPEDFFPEYGRYTFVYTGFTFQDIDYSELITSIQNHELFDNEFSYIGNRPVKGKEFDPSSIRKISPGDQFGNLTVEDANFSFDVRLDHGCGNNAPQSGYVKLGGSVTLKGVAVKETDILFYVYPDSIRETEFPFLNLGNRSTMVSADGLGLYSEYTTLCFLLDENDIDFGDRSFCEAEITFTDIEQSWDQYRNDDYFGLCICTAEKAKVKILQD